MATAEAVQVRRGGAMVGPRYLYNGSQVCGQRTGRTCIFLLASFGVSFSLIGLVFFTADLRMESGLWIAGVVFILLGAALLVWFMTLCCAARCAFKRLPPSHPARVMPSSAAPVQPRSSTYQLLPMSPNRTQVTPSSSVLAAHTLPTPATQKARAAATTGYSTWNHAAWKYGTPQPDIYGQASAPTYGGDYQGLRGHPLDCTMTEYSVPTPMATHTLTPMRTHTLTPMRTHTRTPMAMHTLTPMATHTLTPRATHTIPRAPPDVSLGIYSPMGVAATHTSRAAYVAEDKPPPYHTVVSEP